MSFEHRQDALAEHGHVLIGDVERLAFVGLFRQQLLEHRARALRVFGVAAPCVVLVDHVEVVFAADVAGLLRNAQVPSAAGRALELELEMRVASRHLHRAGLLRIEALEFIHDAGALHDVEHRDGVGARERERFPVGA